MGQKIHPYGFRLGITQEHKSKWFAKPSKKGEFSKLIAEDSAIRTMLFQQLRQFGLTDVHVNRHADFLQVVLYVSKPRVFAQQLHQNAKANTSASMHEEYTNRRINPFSSYHVKRRNTNWNLSIAQRIVYTLKYIHRHSLVQQLNQNDNQIAYTASNTPTLSSSVHEHQDTDALKNTEGLQSQGEITPTLSNSINLVDDSKLSVIIKRSDSYSARAIAEEIKADLQKRTPFRRALKQALSVIKQSNGNLREEIKGAKIQVAGRLNGSEIARTEWTREGQVPLHTLRAKIDFCYVPAFTSYGVLGIKVWVYTNQATRELS